MKSYIVKKALNNNVLIANSDQNEEVVLIGKGIGFNHKKNDSVNKEVIEKVFVLKNEKEQQHYKELLPHIDTEILDIIISSTELIRRKSKVILNEQDRKSTRLNSSHVAISYAVF